MADFWNSIIDQGNKLGNELNKNAESLGDMVKGMKDEVIKGTSIIAKTKNSILQFPVYITNSGIRANEAHLFAKLLERVYASYVQNVLSLNKIQSEEDLKNLKFIDKIHTNIKESTIYHNAFYEPIDEFDRILKEGTTNTIHVGNIQIHFEGTRLTPWQNRNLIMESIRLSNEPLAGFYFEDKKPASSKVEDTTEEKEIPDTVLTDEMLNRLKGTLTVDELKDRIKAAPRGMHTKLGNKDVEIFYRTNKDGEEEFFIPRRKQVTRTSIIERKDRDKTIAAAEILRDSDIKKINGMLPYGIKCTFRVSGELNAADVEFLIGVKTIMHLVDIKDLKNDLHNILEGNMKKLRKIKYKTGEIGFLDYWFNISDIKRDAAKRLNVNTRWISTLKKLANYNKASGGMFKSLAEVMNSNLPIPNASLIISKMEIDDIKDSIGIDLGNVDTANKLMNQLFLICFMVVDHSAGTMRVLLNGDKEWDTQAIGQIDADLSKIDNSAALKDLGKMLFTKGR